MINSFLGFAFFVAVCFSSTLYDVLKASCEMLHFLLNIVCNCNICSSFVQRAYVHGGTKMGVNFFTVQLVAHCVLYRTMSRSWIPLRLF